jgi:hypothetical protein
MTRKSVNEQSTLRDKDERIALLEAEVAELKAYLPMLARLAFFEGWADAGSIPNAILRLEKWTRLGYGCEEDDYIEWMRSECSEIATEFHRPKSEPLPQTAQAVQGTYDARTG